MLNRIGFRLRATSLTVIFAIASCAESTHDGLDDSPATRAKIAPALEEKLTAGLSQDVLVELDETADDNDGVDGGALHDALTGAVQTDVGDLPPSAADPMRAAMMKRKVELYGRLQDRVLNSIDPNEIVLLHQYANLPLMFVHVASLRAALELAALPQVLRLHEDAQLHHSLTESLPLIHQPQAAAAGKTGAGTAVAVLDTGCDFTRSAFGSCSAAGATGCKVAYAADFAPDDGSNDDNGHGTNVSAIVLGVAPSTKVLALDVFAGSGASSSTILQAVDWTIQHRTNYNIVAMNLSLGGGLFTSACTSDVFASSLANARMAGIVPVVASGNDASSTSIASPACVPAAVSVGAVYDSNIGGISFPTAGCSDSTTSADKIACFSNSNALLSVLAPGAPITAGGYTMTGTSQATPHVAGALAVVRSAFPNEALNDSIARITGSGPSIADPRNAVSRHRLDLFAAISGSGGTVSAPPDTTGPTGSVVVNTDAAATKSTSVVLTINASDPSGVGTMCIANTTSCTSFSAFAPSKTWTLTSGDGLKTVTVIVKDSKGNASTFSDTIRLDATVPSGGTLSARPSNQQVALTWTAATDAGTGIASYAIVVAPVTAPTCSAGSLVYSGTATNFTH
ncbi:MAG TPA: S8 family serine peptidase, partial [Polyangiales bacterium]|nr:S8 family serine peptidase [Polyangiales bacterium]